MEEITKKVEVESNIPSPPLCIDTKSEVHPRPRTRTRVRSRRAKTAEDSQPQPAAAIVGDNDLRMGANTNRSDEITCTPPNDFDCEFVEGKRNAHAPVWSVDEAINILVGTMKRHPIPFAFGASLLFFMAVEYTIPMVPPSSPPFDIGFIVTHSLNSLLASRPTFNSILAALNTVFVGMQTSYILWTLLVEGRPRATIAALFMFTCRGILGCSTQLPLPQGFLGSGMDFPVGNVSFFLFFSGHVAGSMIASLDMRRTNRWKMAWAFDVLNVMQGIRLLASRGHYTIDLVVGLGAGFLFDILAGRYLQSKKENKIISNSERPGFEEPVALCRCCICHCSGG